MKFVKKLLSVILVCVVMLGAGVSTIASAAMSKGWQKDSVGWWYSPDAKTYHKNGWAQIDGKWYYFNGSGYICYGWKQIDGKWYFFDNSGAMKTGWVFSGGKWYLMSNSGAMCIGWAYSGGRWYLLSNSGAMCTGWAMSGGKWYYFTNSGAMARNLMLGDWWIGNDGVAVEIMTEEKLPENLPQAKPGDGNNNRPSGGGGGGSSSDDEPYGPSVHEKRVAVGDIYHVNALYMPDMLGIIYEAKDIEDVTNVEVLSAELSTGNVSFDNWDISGYPPEIMGWKDIVSSYMFTPSEYFEEGKTYKLTISLRVTYANGKTKTVTDKMNWTCDGNYIML